jgi:hypothetical protein
MRRYETSYSYVFRNDKTGEYRKYYGSVYSPSLAKTKIGIPASDTYDWKLMSSTHSFKPSK